MIISKLSAKFRDNWLSEREITEGTWIMWI